MRRDHCHHCGDAPCTTWVPMFRGLSLEEHRRLASLIEHRTVKAGEVIVHENDVLSGLFFVHSGQCKLAKVTQDGREQIFHLLWPGDFFGEAALFRETPLLMEAVAVEDGMVCLLRRNDFRETILESPAAAWTVLQAMAERMASLEGLVDTLASTNLNVRIARLLLTMDRKEGSPDWLELSLTREELAQAVGTTRESVSRRLHELAKRGVLVVDGRRLQIVDRFALEELAGQNLPHSE